MPKKGKKKSKAELEAERLEAEEQARKEAEAEARRLEAERVKREAEEKKLREEQAAFRTEEVARLEAETADFQPELKRAAAALAKEQADKGAEVEWAKYMACDPTPDASSEAELNTYISIIQDEKPSDLGEAFRQSAHTEVVARDLIRVMAAAQAQQDQARYSQCAQFLQQLRQTSANKFDSASLYIIQHSDEFLDEDGQVLLGQENQDFRVGMWVNLNFKPFRGVFKPIAFGDIGLQVDIPKQLNQMELAIRSAFMPYDNWSLLCSAPPCDIILGGVMQLELFALPPSPKQIKPGWVMRPSDELSNGLQVADTPYSSPEAAFGGLAPLRLSFTLPEYVYHQPQGNPKVVMWDDKAKEWSTEHVDQTATEYNVSSRLLRFHSTRTGLFALVHSRVEDLPFREWRLEPAIEVRPPAEHATSAVGGRAAHSAAVLGADDLFQDEGCVHFTLLARSVEVRLQITTAGCRLLQPELPGLYLKLLEPGQLLHALLRVGINLMPLDSDAAEMDNYFGQIDVEPGIVPKCAPLEARLVDDIASLAASFDFVFSRWNNQLGEKRCAFRARETSVFTGGNEETFDLDMVLMECDAASTSARNAPGIGDLSGTGVKCALVRQTEEASHEFQTRKKEVQEANDAAQKAAVDAAVAAAEADQELAEPELLPEPEETFDDCCLQGQVSHVYLQTALQTVSSEEAMERVHRAAPSLRFMVKQVLTLTRPFSFTN